MAKREVPKQQKTQRTQTVQQVDNKPELAKKMQEKIASKAKKDK